MNFRLMMEVGFKIIILRLNSIFNEHLMRRNFLVSWWVIGQPHISFPNHTCLPSTILYHLRNILYNISLVCSKEIYFLYTKFGIEIYDYIFQLYIGSKSILLVKLIEIWQDISWENGNIYAEEGKNSFNSFLRYSYFQLTTSLYINPQVVYITQHTHTDLELILKRILKIMISKGVAGTKNSFSVFNFEVMTQSILYPYIHWYSFCSCNLFSMHI